MKWENGLHFYNLNADPSLTLLSKPKRRAEFCVVEFCTSIKARVGASQNPHGSIRCGAQSDGGRWTRKYLQFRAAWQGIEFAMSPTTAAAAPPCDWFPLSTFST